MKPLNKNERFVDQLFGTLAKMADKPILPVEPVPPVREIEVHLNQTLIDFDALFSNEEVWVQEGTLPSWARDGFRLVFQVDRIHLVYEDTGEGIERAHELLDSELDEILSVLIQYKNWKQPKG